MDFLVPEMQSYHLDMGSLSGAGEVDAAAHYGELYGGRSQVSLLSRIILLTDLPHLLTLEFGIKQATCPLTPPYHPTGRCSSIVRTSVHRGMDVDACADAFRNDAEVWFLGQTHTCWS